MVTTEQFIKALLEERTMAAGLMTKSVSVDGIDVSAGCDERGIRINSGLDKLAKIFGKEIHLMIDVEDMAYYEIHYRYIEFNGVWLYTSNMVEKKPADEADEEENYDI